MECRIDPPGDIIVEKHDLVQLGQENVVADNDNMRGPLVKPFDVIWLLLHVRIRVKLDSVFEYHGLKEDAGAESHVFKALSASRRMVGAARGGT